MKTTLGRASAIVAALGITVLAGSIAHADPPRDHRDNHDRGHTQSYKDKGHKDWGKKDSHHDNGRGHQGAVRDWGRDKDKDHNHDSRWRYHH